MPVEATAYTKAPSACRSRATTACHLAVLVIYDIVALGVPTRYPDLAVELAGTQVAKRTRMESPNPLSAQLDRLAEFEGATAPFVSLYLNAQPNDRGRDQFSPFLRRELRPRVATYPLNTPARESLERDVQRIEAYVASEIQPSANGVAIFACAGADDFFEAVQLEAPIDEHRLFISDRPHLYPLAQLDSRYPRCAAVLCDTNRARIVVVALARVEQEREVIGTKTRRHSMGGWSQARYQRHIDNYHQQHIKEVVETLARIVRDENIPHIALFGDAIAIPMLQEELPANLRALVIEESSLPTGSDTKVVLEKMIEVLEKHNAETDREKVEELMGAYRAGGLGVVGVEAVRTALQIGQVDDLLISPPGQPLDAEIIDALVAQARQTSAQVTVIEDASLLSAVGGVGALLRYKVPGIQPTRTQPAVGAPS
jgi:peptide chain release factor subunit 1